MSLLSIIIPVYNVENYLEECLNSVINQTYKNLEIICVNDGSTDKSPAILENYAKIDNRIKIINQSNKGQAAARNAGLRVATGEYITFVDSDDFIELQTYETVLRYIDKVDIVCFGVSVFGDIYLERRNDDNNYYKVKYKGCYVLNDYIRKNIDCSPCNKIFKKHIIDKYNISFPGGLYYEDAAFYWEYIINAHKVFFLKNSFYNYRRRKGSTMDKTFSNSGIAIDHLHIVRVLYDYFVKINKLDSKMDLFLDLFNDYFYFAYNYSSKRNKPKVLAEGTRLAQKFELSDNILIKHLRDKKYSQIDGVDYLTFWQKIFSIKNKKTHKIYTILGIRLKMKNKFLENKESLKCLENKFEYTAKSIGDMQNQLALQSKQIKILTQKIEELCC